MVRWNTTDRKYIITTLVFERCSGDNVCTVLAFVYSPSERPVHTSTAPERSRRDDYARCITFTPMEKKKESKPPYTLVQCRIRWYCNIYRVSHKMHTRLSKEKCLKLKIKQFSMLVPDHYRRSRLRWKLNRTRIWLMHVGYLKSPIPKKTSAPVWTDFFAQPI